MGKLLYRLLGHRDDLYVEFDPQSVKDAEEREEREHRAASKVVSVTRTSAEALEREAFWRAVDKKRAAPKPRKIVRFPA